MKAKRLDPWPAWMAVAGLGFAVFETRALVRGDIPTLSENLAKWSGVHPRRVHGNVVPVLLLAGAGWLVVHIATWGSGNPGDASKWVPVMERKLELLVTNDNDLGQERAA